MPVVTLTSDYGYSDYRVATIKGSLLTGDDAVVITDITHAIRTYDIQQAAYILRRTYRTFPKGTVHIVAVDCLYHPQRRNLIYKVNEHFILAADNGFISLLHPEFELEEVYEITYNNRFDDVVDFTPRDIFVPAALHLVRGGVPEIMGRKIQNPARLVPVNAAYKEKFIVGQIVFVDCFGNLVTNIAKEKFDEMNRIYPYFEIKFRNIIIPRIIRNYTDFISDWTKEREYYGREYAQFNEEGFLEIIIYGGKKSNGASNLFGMKEGEQVYIEFIEKK